MMKYVAIVKNETAFDHEPWIKACDKMSDKVSYDVIDLLANDWLLKIKQKEYVVFLLRPSGLREEYKRLYDERIYILNRVLNKQIYPSLDEVLIYENKRFLRDWLMAQQLPHPGTFVFYNKDEALSFIKKRTDFPLVGKTNIGASGSGVRILKGKVQVEEYVNEAFSTGIKAKSGPKLNKGSLLKKLWKALTKKGFLKQRMRDYDTASAQRQQGFVILQHYISHEYEWRCVRIGDSYFAHKKMVKDGMASGTLAKGYDQVPFELLDFIRETTEKTKLSSVAVDVFEQKGAYLINEIQCFFGQSDPYQMLVEGHPGRYRYLGNQWVFESGDFNANESYDLRLLMAINNTK